MENVNKNEKEITYNLKGFAVFFSGQLFSILGSSVIQFVLAWWITIETESPLLLSLSLFIGFIPTIILTPIAGVFVDRWNRKLLIGSADFLQAAVTVVLLFLFMFNKVTLWIIFIVLALRGVFQAFHQPSIQALIPIMVPRKHLSRSNSIQYFLTSIIYLIGPIVAALLFTILPIHHILWLEAITFVIAFIPLIFIKIPKIEKKVKDKEIDKPSFFSEFKEGISFMKEKKGLLPLLGSFAATNLFLMPLFTLLNLYIYTNHGGGETDLAFVLAFNQAGTIAGTVLFIFWKGFKKKVNGVVLGIVVGFIGFMMLALTPTGIYWLMGIGFLVMGFAVAAANISSQTIWQHLVPREMLGRIMSVRIAIAQFISPVGMILSGLIAEFVKIQYVYIASATLGIISIGSFYFFSSMRKVEEGIVFESEEEDPIESIDENRITDELQSDAPLSFSIEDVEQKPVSGSLE